jgi:hypothetical protein
MRWEFEEQDDDSEDEELNFGFSGQLSEDMNDFSGYFYVLGDKDRCANIDFYQYSDDSDSD